MATRRLFLQGAVGTAALAGTPAIGTTLPANHSYKLLAFIDIAHAQGGPFAAAAHAWGARTVALRGDPLALWHDAVLTSAVQPKAILGLTTQGTLFCLERLGWELGLRVRRRIDHLPAPDGTWRHVAHTDLPAWAPGMLAGAGSDFGLAAASSAFNSSGSAGDCTHAAPPPHPHRNSTPLVTWLLAAPDRA
ncbi:hypothetical protein FHW96_001376 [Novosphingobium sp. SG751A]|uniref:hypothetical protein n=1 Tax=Novosphingobium sp. SG751A TaxID=2587000 RepID=UPI00155385F3|nr:hypothetical protein [Novosphingobium sp. SG751A]NOW45221.1 hypothetical protein [Novosphingobium sp. SG751A]